ncbi:MAG: hypothetical protein AB1726_08160 [Planctomycetota bacterium]
MLATPRLPFVLLLLAAAPAAQSGSAIVVDHTSTRLPEVPAAGIDQAKANLHIAYGHTSHGSQITTGMEGLVGFTGGCGGPQFAWNNGGTNGALDLDDYAMPGDLTYFPQWVDETRAYLNDPKNADVNVVLWAWCESLTWYTTDDLRDRYIVPMVQLELDYPWVRFVYMTGHVDVRHKANVEARNQEIRTFCRNFGKVLYDFADIESYDPDGRYFAYADEDCSYYARNGTTLLGNWAIAWQDSHVLGVDWYQCAALHSQPLNANRKAYAAWWLWARLAGWPGRPELAVSTDGLSAATGGTADFALAAGPTHANRLYLLLGSLTGTGPGTPLPGTSAVLPLNWDFFTDASLQGSYGPPFAGFLGVLDANGAAAATFALPALPPAADYLSIHFAYLLPAVPPRLVSNAVAVRIVQ